MMINGEYVRGRFDHDRSLRYYRNNRPYYHDCYRIDVRYKGRRWRTRYKSPADAEKALLALKEKYIDEYVRKCDWCGNLFEITNGNKRFCCVGCRAKAEKALRNKSGGFRVIDDHGRHVSMNKINKS